jgi:hypothetical protein
VEARASAVLTSLDGVTGVTRAMEPSVLIDASYAAMRRAVELARSGRCSNWWTVQARMRTLGYKIVDLEWTEMQRAWLDQLCAEARTGVS